LFGCHIGPASPVIHPLLLSLFGRHAGLAPPVVLALLLTLFGRHVGLPLLMISSLMPALSLALPLPLVGRHVRPALTIVFTQPLALLGGHIGTILCLAFGRPLLLTLLWYHHSAAIPVEGLGGGSIMSAFCQGFVDIEQGDGGAHPTSDFRTYCQLRKMPTSPGMPPG
jgi:hypothetical protein